MAEEYRKLNKQRVLGPERGWLTSYDGQEKLAAAPHIMPEAQDCLSGAVSEFITAWFSQCMSGTVELRGG